MADYFFTGGGVVMALYTFMVSFYTNDRSGKTVKKTVSVRADTSINAQRLVKGRYGSNIRLCGTTRMN